MKQTAEYVQHFINQTEKPIFLTGKAGTGKTTLLNEIVRTTHKRCVVVAPTGIAALNAGGVTIHSMFQLPFATFIPDFGEFQQVSDRMKIETRDSLRRHRNVNKKRISLLRNLELLIIDEVSMLRADLLDAMDWMLRNTRKINQPFGGVQVLFIGDLLQLPPVVKPEEWHILSKYYAGIFFFHSKVIQENQPIYIELDKIYRQQDEQFINLLNKLRNNAIGEEEKRFLNRYVQKDFDEQKNPGYVTLTTHNYKAQDINSSHLNQLKSKSVYFNAEIKGDFPPHLFPIDERLELKKGAQVMFVKNDLSNDKNYFNGKMGKIKEISEHEILVHFEEENKVIEVDKYEWENIRYSLNEETKEIEEKVIGTFVQYPIKTAWAITVHKSQGLTFEKAILDVSSAFAPGQAYVALSRLRSLDGLVLLQEFSLNSMSNDQNVMAYVQQKNSTSSLEERLGQESQKYILSCALKAFDWPELTSAWRVHAASYKNLSAKSLKIKNAEWAFHQNHKLEQLQDPARKFHQQLRNIFAAPSLDLEFMFSRIEAAYNYFYKVLDDVYFSLLKKMEEIKRKPKVALYFEELSVMEELHGETIFELKKIYLLAECVSKGLTINKKILKSDEFGHYKLAKLALAKQELRQEKTTLDFDQEEEYDDEVVIPIKKAKKSAKSKSKVSTYDQTLELILEGQSITEIAYKRMLGEGTIYGHLSRLISQEKLEITSVLNADQLEELSKLFAGFDGESLGSLKEKCGDRFSWDELRLYRAHLIK